MKKRALLSAFLVVICVLSLIAATTGVFGWLIKSEKKEFGVTASVHKSYYESGDGLSPETAFEIARPMQLYYFAWLQNLGYYNAVEGDQSALAAGQMASPVYFKVSNDLDMTGFTLPAIGTTEYPFVGVFDGGGHTVYNLTVSNTTESSELTYSPTGYEDVVGFQIVGTFGVIGKIGDAPVLYETSAAAVINTVLQNVTVKTQDPLDASSLIGVAAGYVNGKMENVVVIGGSVVIENGITPLVEYSSSYSEFGLIGYCEDDRLISINLNVAEVAEPFVDTTYVPGSISLGVGDNWGGSIDMKALNLRLYTLLNSGNVTYSSRSYFGYYQDEYQGISVGRSSGVQTYYVSNPTTRRIYYYLLGNGRHTYRSQNFTMPGTYIPLLVDDNFATLDCNTGYIVSDTESLSGVSGTIRSSSYETRFISNSLDDVNLSRSQVNNGTGTFPSYDKTKLEVITPGSTVYGANGFVLVKDEMDGFNGNHVPTYSSAVYGMTKNDGTTPSALGLGKYDAARISLDSVLDGASFIHGIHFVGSSISINKTMTVPTALINGVTYSNYQLPKSAINFRVKEEGFINCFAGSYYSRSSGSWADSFFSLHEVFRNGNTITAIKEIQYIYENLLYDSNVLGSPKYVYGYSGETKPSSAGALVFDMRYLTEQPPVDNALYYFEIPVNAGEYALGTVAGKSGGGYLMYLDISASASDMHGNKRVETTRSVRYYYEYPDGISLSDDGVVPPAVLATRISQTGLTPVNLLYADTDEFTELLVRDASHSQTTQSAVSVRLVKICEMVKSRVTINETVNGTDTVYVITTITTYRKDASGNVLSMDTICTATKDGVSIAVPSGYGDAVGFAGDSIISWHAVDYGEPIDWDAFCTDAGTSSAAVTVVSSETVVLYVGLISEGWSLTVNGSAAESGDQIIVAAT